MLMKSYVVFVCIYVSVCVTLPWSAVLDVVARCSAKSLLAEGTIRSARSQRAKAHAIWCLPKTESIASTSYRRRRRVCHIARACTWQGQKTGDLLNQKHKHTHTSIYNRLLSFVSDGISRTIRVSSPRCPTHNAGLFAPSPDRGTIHHTIIIYTYNTSRSA